MGDETAIQATPNPPKPTDDGNAAIQTTPSAPVAGLPPRDDIDVTRRKPAGFSVEKALTSLAGLRLTVYLLAIGLLLVFFGTLAQMDQGIHAILQKYFRCWLAWVPLQIFVRFGQIFLGFPHTWQVGGSFPFPGGWAIGLVMLVNLCAAHAVRFRLTWKRSGVLILHAGLIVLMMGELVTGLFSVESRMTIWEGSSASYTESHNDTELAVVDASNPNSDDVVVIPESKLKKGGLIQHEALPFDVEVLEYMVNSSEPRPVKPGMPNRATAGEGLSLLVDKIPEVSGTEGDRTDLAATYVTFKEKGTGKSLGTYLLSIWFSHPLLFNKGQQVKVGDKDYTVSLRHQREYKPYTVYLKKFTHELYPGTTIPKNFSSKVELVDSSRNEQRETDIFMNNPLRYEGETFYQSGFLPGDRGTILQVVHNPGDWLPYWSCILVTLGMMMHFGITLTGFMQKQLQLDTLKVPNREGPLPFKYHWLGMLSMGLTRKMKGLVVVKGSPFAQFFPWLVVGFALLYIGYSLVPRNHVSDQMKLDEFGRLPVLQGGRPKPIDTLARDNLMVISGQQTFKDDKGREQPATKWLLDVMVSQFDKDEAAMRHKVFRIDNLEVLSLLGLERRAGFRYAPGEFARKINELEREASRARQVDAKSRTPYETKLVELAEHLQLYIEISQMEKLLLVPPKTEDGEWRSWPQVLRHEKATGEKDEGAHSVVSLLGAYVQREPDKFNSELETYRAYLEKNVPENAQRTNFEFAFNSFRPFYICMMLYVLVFLLSCFSWLGWSAPLRSAAFWLAVLTLILNTGAFIGRMYLMDRWAVFVTNLYATGVFIGWVITVMALCLEVIFPLGIATAGAGLLGFLTALLSHYLARTGGDTLGMMQAVLDTNFWLATHVTIINIGYGATLLAGGLGFIYLFLAMSTRLIDDEMKKALGTMIYGTVCFAVLFSFTGTVLGGIWADQSWGRFWGWDPKENGALMIVMWNALILHARWCGLVKQTGVATLALVGNMITLWSWIGTNQLGVGLHAYGFNNTLAMIVSILWAVHLVPIAVALLPRGWWRSPAAA